MKNNKTIRNLWLFSGVCFFITFLLNLASNNSTFVIILDAIASVLMFINAYLNHKKIKKDNKD